MLGFALFKALQEHESREHLMSNSQLSEAELQQALEATNIHELLALMAEDQVCA